MPRRSASGDGRAGPRPGRSQADDPVKAERARQARIFGAERARRARSRDSGARGAAGQARQSEVFAAEAARRARERESPDAGHVPAAPATPAPPGGGPRGVGRRPGAAATAPSPGRTRSVWPPPPPAAPRRPPSPDRSGPVRARRPRPYDRPSAPPPPSRHDTDLDGDRHVEVLVAGGSAPEPPRRRRKAPAPAVAIAEGGAEAGAEAADEPDPAVGAAPVEAPEAPEMAEDRAGEPGEAVVEAPPEAVVEAPPEAVVGAPAPTEIDGPAGAGDEPPGPPDDGDVEPPQPAEAVTAGAAAGGPDPSAPSPTWPPPASAGEDARDSFLRRQFRPLGALRIAVLAVVVAVLTGFIGAVVWANNDTKYLRQDSPIPPPPVRSPAAAAPDEETTTTTRPDLSTEALAAKVGPSVFSVSTLDGAGRPVQGSAFMAPTNGGQGLLVTSLAVVEAATRQPGPDITVKGAGYSGAAQLWTWDEAHDLALLVIGRTSAPVPPWIDPSRPVHPGDKIFAVGADRRVSFGVVTAASPTAVAHNVFVDNQLRGGPLVNVKGEVVAISSAAYVAGTPTDTTFFGVPITTACTVVLKCGGLTPPDASPSTASPSTTARARTAVPRTVPRTVLVPRTVVVPRTLAPTLPHG